MFKRILTTITASLLLTSAASADVYEMVCEKSQKSDSKHYTVTADSKKKIIVVTMDNQLFVFEASNVYIHGKQIIFNLISSRGKPIEFGFWNFEKGDSTTDGHRYVKSYDFLKNTTIVDDCFEVNN